MWNSHCRPSTTLVGPLFVSFASATCSTVSPVVSMLMVVEERRGGRARPLPFARAPRNAPSALPRGTQPVVLATVPCHVASGGGGSCGWDGFLACTRGRERARARTRGKEPCSSAARWTCALQTFLIQPPRARTRAQSGNRTVRASVDSNWMPRSKMEKGGDSWKKWKQIQVETTRSQPHWNLPAEAGARDLTAQSSAPILATM